MCDDANVKMYIQIEVQSEDEKKEIGNKIHKQLMGNQDYIDSNILLNIDEPYTIRLWIFKECKSVPSITI